MEAFGIALYALGGLLAAPLFCLLIARYSRRFLTLSAIAWWGSAGLLTLFVLDVAWVHLAGAVSVRAAVGAAFFPLHAVPRYSQRQLLHPYFSPVAGTSQDDGQQSP
jgi:MFS family permease